MNIVDNSLLIVLYFLSALMCEGDSVCAIEDTLAHCVCPVGRTGPRCETLLGGCYVEPCQHGGECFDAGLSDLFICTCKGGKSFTGVCNIF